MSDQLKFLGPVDSVQDYLRLIKELDLGIYVKADMLRQKRTILLRPKKARSCTGCQFLNHSGRYSSDCSCLLGFHLEDNATIHEAKPKDICLPCKSNNNTLSYEESALQIITNLRYKIIDWKNYLNDE